METSFQSRVDQAFGALVGCSSQGGAASRSASADVAPLRPGDPAAAAGSWSVSAVAIPHNQGSRDADESSGSESDEPCSARYEKFVQLARRTRKRRATEDDENLNEEDDSDQGRGTKRVRGLGMEGQVTGDNGPEDLDEDEECRQMRLMVGMDDTLDFEEEEDEYDKVAVGREGDDERVYMREIKDAGFSSSALTSLPPDQGFERKRFRRDSRANHVAAAARLKEDDRLAAVKNSDVAEMSMRSSSPSSARMLDGNTESAGNVVDMNGISNPRVPGSLTSNVPSDFVQITANVTPEPESFTSSELANVRGSAANILSRDGGRGTEQQIKDGKKRQDDGGSGDGNKGKLKRVRFAVEDSVIEEKQPVSGVELERPATVLRKRNRFGGVPDHVRNPSKYTRYTLDWSDEEDDNKSNWRAFQATWAATHASDEVVTTTDLPKSITFTRRGGDLSKKGNDSVKPTAGSGLQQPQALVSFAEDLYSEETSHLEENRVNVNSKTVRVFRKRAQDDGKNDNNEDDSSAEPAHGQSYPSETGTQ